MDLWRIHQLSTVPATNLVIVLLPVESGTFNIPIVMIKTRVDTYSGTQVSYTRTLSTDPSRFGLTYECVCTGSLVVFYVSVSLLLVLVPDPRTRTFVKLTHSTLYRTYRSHAYFCALKSILVRAPCFEFNSTLRKHTYIMPAYTYSRSFQYDNKYAKMLLLK